MRKLLNQTLIYYSVFALIMLLLTSPLFYWMSHKLHIDDVDEAIRLREKEFLTEPKWRKLNRIDIDKWNEFNRDIKILPDTSDFVTKGQVIQQVFYDTLNTEWEPYRVLYRDIAISKGKAVLMIKINLIESADLIQSTAIIFIAVLFILLLGFAWLTKIVSGKLWDPFYKTLSQIEVFDIEKNYQEHFNETKTIEFHKLQQVLSKLISENKKAFDREKEFTQNASHELQTPLAVIQSKLDILLQNQDLTVDQARILQQLYDATARLLRINKNLLLLSRIENKHFTPTEKLDLRIIIEEVLPYFEEQSWEKSLDLKWSYSGVSIISANKGLTETLVNNLFLNAIRHNVFGGHIIITLDNNHLSIKNSGIDTPLNEKTIFNRFSRGLPHSQSSGLGLAIVKRISEINNWQITYSFMDNNHMFSVRF